MERTKYLEGVIENANGVEEGILEIERKDVDDRDIEKEEERIILSREAFKQIINNQYYTILFKQTKKEKLGNLPNPVFRAAVIYACVEIIRIKKTPLCHYSAASLPLATKAPL